MDLYKIWVRIFASYLDKAPAQGYDSMFNALTDRGVKVLPSDPLALDILRSIATPDNPATALHKLSTYRFKNLDKANQPIIKGTSGNSVAFWKVGDVVSDKINSLMAWEKDQKGSWVDEAGETAKVIK